MVVLVFLIALLLSFPSPANAIYDPLSVPNNKFGIHIADSNDIDQLPPLLNSSGGDWGYVTLVIADNDRDPGKWQKIFDKMRRLHLIPIVRLATHVEGNAWAIPKKDSFREWVDFLSKMRWVVKNRYVILFNEPNHAKEWGYTINPEQYADVLATLGKALKDASPDFFILPAGMDVSAASDNQSIDAHRFLQRMFAAKPEIKDIIDGWSSHAYPNPGFSGSVYGWGRGTLRTFDWELAALKQLGVTKTLPVFITETGWIHSEGKLFNKNLLSPQQVGENLRIAAQTIWNDPRIVAITPFVFNYQDYPFDHFSWKKIGTNEYYAHYSAYQSIPKQKGMPRQAHKFEFTTPLLPDKMVVKSSYTFTTKIKNIGEGTLEPDIFDLVITDGISDFSTVAESLPTLEPGEIGDVTIHIKTPEKAGIYALTVQLKNNVEFIPIEHKTLSIIPPPTIRLFGQLGWKKTSEAADVTVLIYQKDTLVHKTTGLPMKDGMVTVEHIAGIVPKEEYRIVMLVPQYLPRQTIASIEEQQTDIGMKRFFPLDLNRDGTWNLSDIFTLFQLPPNTVFSLWFSP